MRRDLFKFLESRIEDLEAAVSNRPMFGPGSLNGKMLRPKSVVSSMIDVDNLEAVNANTGDLSVSGTITIGPGGSIVDADGSTWDQSGLTLVAAGAIGDVLSFEIGSPTKTTAITFTDLGAGDSQFILRNFEDYAAFVSSSTVTNTSAVILRVDDVTAANNYAVLQGIGPTLTGSVTASGGGTVTVDGDTTFRDTSANTLATLVSTNRALTAYGRFYPGADSGTPNTTGYIDWNTTPDPDRMRIVGATLEVPGLYFETTTATATYLTFKNGSNPAVTFDVDGSVGSTGANLTITADHSSANRGAIMTLEGQGAWSISGLYNGSGDNAYIAGYSSTDTNQSIELVASNATRGDTAIYIVADDTASSSYIRFDWEGTEIVRFNGDANTDTTLGSLVGQIPVKIAGGATQYYIPYYAA